MRSPITVKISKCPTCQNGWYTGYDERSKFGKLDIDATRAMPAPPALSRRDNRTYICSDCGTREAVEDFARYRSSYRAGVSK